jgi:hypothetical protein
MQRIALTGALCALVAGTCAAASAATATVPGGTTVPVHVTATLSSASAKVGQTFAIKATSAVGVGSQIVIENGAVGQGTVVSATPAGKSGRQGALSIKFQWIYAIDGSKIKLAGINRNLQGKNKTGSSNTANVVSTVVLGPVGLFAHNFVKGHEVAVDPTYTFSAYTGSAAVVTLK